MSSKWGSSALFVALIFVIGISLGNQALGQTPNVEGDGTTGAYPKAYYRLGVRGKDTEEGLLIRTVTEGSRATRLGRNPVISLEAGDRIVEVDGAKLDLNYTFRDAILDSNGVIDLKVWDNRNGKYVQFRGVKLDLIRQR